MTDPTRDEVSRYDRLGPVARALVDDYDELDLAAMLVKAQDELAALRTVARGYCPACGRGDAAPSVEDWEQQRQRADCAVAALRNILNASDAPGHCHTQPAVWDGSGPCTYCTAVADARTLLGQPGAQETAVPPAPYPAIGLTNTKEQ